MHQSERKARYMLSLTITSKLWELWECTEKAQITPNVATVRGWLIDELEKRGAMVWDDAQNDFIIKEVA